jgi:hypothetical protein
MRKTIVCVQFLLITIASLAGLSGVAIASPTSIEVVPSSLEQLPGGSFLVNITVNDMTDLYLWMFRLRWNNTVLQLNSIEEGPFLQDEGDTSGIWLSPPTIPEIDAAGKIDEATCSLLGPVPGVNGSGTIATLNFTCLSMGDSALEFWEEASFYEPATDLLDSNLESISHTATPGEVTVIPEFPGMLLTAVFLVATLFAVVLGKKVYSKRLRVP